ncbi:Condensin-2 complex subunit D3 [Papilio machaon]|uniref:Condensin-2 complex subunit D3 n=1 Tax=Papilio machaon TaxID=76193 RepID=A0A0N1IQE4_PAPMA|nr:Condensin-2 complex subunit D3 [Papilio machaon]
MNRYACIVEPLLGSISQCVDIGTAPPLRRAAARALTRLLLAGYLRLRTPLYYRYCALLADEEHDVREPAEYYVSSCLTADHIYHHFVDCLLYYNSDEGGGLSFDARQLIYDVMLQRLSAVQKLNVQCRVAREVLQHAADLCDDSDTLPDTLHAALLDTITLLCGPRMKLPKKPQTTGDTADIDDLTERVTSNIVSYKMKRTVAEVLVPAVLRLYAHMRPRGGQLAAYLVRIATDLLADYRQEIEELIQLDEELVQRIRQFQETIGLEPSFGNARNLVTASAPPDPDTPRAHRKRPPHRHHAKRALRI